MMEDAEKPTNKLLGWAGRTEEALDDIANYEYK